jgi:hypothetical protein
MDTIRIEFPIKNSDAFSEEEAVSEMVKGLNKLIEFGALKGKLDDFIQNYEVANPGGYAVAIINRDALVDASKLNSIGSSLSFPIEKTPDRVEIEERSFSASTIQERLRMSGLNPRMKFRSTILDYQKYYKSNQSKLKKTPVLMTRLKNMFVVDMMGIFNEILPYIQEGKQLATLTGLTTVTEGLNTVSKDLSVAYRKALIQSKDGQLSRSVLQNLQRKYSEFMNILIPQVFPGIEEMKLLPGVVNKTKIHSEIDEGSIKVKASNPDKLFDMMDYIKEIGNGGHSFKIVVDPEDSEYKREFSWDGDGGDKIISVAKSSISIKEYSVDDEGRIKLF